MPTFIGHSHELENLVAMDLEVVVPWHMENRDALEKLSTHVVSMSAFYANRLYSQPSDNRPIFIF